MSPCVLVKANSNGYRVAMKEGKRVGAHVTAYEKAWGKIPDDWHVHHLCITRNCINPFHLQAVSPREHKIAHGQDGCKGGYTHAYFLADYALDEYERDRDHTDLELSFWIDER